MSPAVVEVLRSLIDVIRTFPAETVDRKAFFLLVDRCAELERMAKADFLATHECVKGPALQ